MGELEEGKLSVEKKPKAGRKSKKPNEMLEDESIPRFKVKPGRKPNLRNAASAMMVGDIKLSFNLTEHSSNEGQFDQEINLGDLKTDKVSKQKSKRKRKLSPKKENVVEGKKLRKSNVREEIEKIMDKVLEEKKVASQSKKDDGNDILDIERRIGVVKERIANIGDSMQEKKGLPMVENTSYVNKDGDIPKKKGNKRSKRNFKSEVKKITNQSPKLQCDDELRKCILDYTGGETGEYPVMSEKNISEDGSEASFSIDSVKDTGSESEKFNGCRKGTGELAEFSSDDGSEAPLVMDLDN